MRVIIGLMAMLMFSTVYAAAPNNEPTPAFMQPEVLQAAAAINLTDAQLPQFRSALSTFVQDRTKAVQKLLRKNNQANLARKVKSKTNSLLKKMDASMHSFLLEEQLPAYENYRSLLKSNLQGM